MTSEQPAPEFSWRSGTWLDALTLLRDLVARLPAERLSDEFNRSVRGSESCGEVAKQRILALAGLLSLQIQDSSGESAADEALRRHHTGEIVFAACQSLTSLSYMSANDQLRPLPSVEANLHLVRSICVEDIECVYDIDRMSHCALALGLFMMEQARRDSRFDDFLIGQRFIQIHLSTADGVSQGGIACYLLDTLVSTPVTSELDADDRVRRIARMVTPLRAFEARYGLPEDITELVERAATMAPADLPVGKMSGDYTAGKERLLSMFHITQNPAYLEDAILYCSAPRDGESDSEKASRLTDWAVILNNRGQRVGRRPDLIDAFAFQLEAIELISVSHPSWVLYRSNAATFELAIIYWDGGDLGPHLEQIRALLPSPNDVAPEGTVWRQLAPAYLIRSQLELSVALRSPGGSEGSVSLAASVEAAECAREFAMQEGDLECLQDAEAMLIASGALCAFREGTENVSIAGLIGLIDHERTKPEARVMCLAILEEILRQHGQARPEVRAALQRVLARQAPYRADRRMESFKLCALLVMVHLDDGDIARGGQDAVDVRIALSELLKIAVTVSAASGMRSEANGPLALAEELCLEAAVQFVDSGAVAVGLTLAMSCTGVMASNAPIWRARSGDWSVRLSELQRMPTPVGLVAAVPGRSSIVIACRTPGSDWTVASRVPVGAKLWSIDSFDDISEFAIFRLYVEWLCDVSRSLLQDAVQSSAVAGRTTLVFLSGELLRLPATVVDSGDGQAIAVVPGYAVGAAADALDARLDDLDRVTVVVGAHTIEGSGVISVEEDLDLLTGIGLPVLSVRSFSHGYDSNALLDADLIHYVGHVVPLGADDAALLMADGSSLSGRSIRELELRKGQCVVLAACDSAWSGSSEHGQVEHLAGAFLEAGARSVVALLWPVRDLPARLFTKAFYSEILGGSSIAQAFSGAVDAVRNHEFHGVRTLAHPTHWAGFTLYAGTSSWWQDRSERAGSEGNGVADVGGV